MLKLYQSPLSINFVWCPSDEINAKLMINAVVNNFSRQTDKPFSRSINLPIFYYSSASSQEVPENSPQPTSKSAITFVFTSVNTVGNANWKKYVESLNVNENLKIVPIALDNFGISHVGALDGLNCIRAYDWCEKDSCMEGLVVLSHEIFRHCFKSGQSDNYGQLHSLKLFLSHSKHDDLGLSYVEDLKSSIDSSSLRRFFDATEIAPGYSFSKEINQHISDSTLVAFVTDSYSSRYWCQKEILEAKEQGRPIIIVNCLADFEDRVFPASSNVPCLTVNHGKKLDRTDVLRILSAALTETIRFDYSLEQLKVFKDAGWFSNDTYLISRPPEIRKMLKLKQEGVEQVCYPEPPIYSEEADWHTAIGIKAITPLWNEEHKELLQSLKIGISISDRKEDFFSKTHTHPDQLTKLAQVIARHLLARSATLSYGGDLRENGFTNFILDEAHVLSDRLKTLDIKIENHLAWPLYIESVTVKAWRAQHHKIMKTIEHTIPNDVSDNLEIDVFLESSHPKNAYIWSRSLTEMRKKIVADCDYRICAGGKAAGFKGKMPGVLEEIMIALDKGKPLFLLGGLNGIVGDICSAIISREIPETLNESWQIANNSGYADLQNIAKYKNQHCDYNEVVRCLKSVKVSELALKVNLSEKEYKTLMQSPYIEECLHLVLKSLSKNKPRILS